jgi:hypothetical protein
MTSRSNSFKAALTKMRPRIVVLQWAGNLALMLIAFLWLQIPDSHLWQFALSMISALLILLAALWLYARTIGYLRRSTTPVLLPMFLLLLFAAVWILLLYLLAFGREKEALYAGFLNSKLPSNLRSFFDYTRLLSWLDHFYDLVQWVLAGLLLPIAFETSSSGISFASLKRAGRVYRHWFYWLVVIVAGFAGSALTRALAGWTPGKGLGSETLSVIVRLGLAYTADILLWCFMLALIAAYLEAEEA